MWRGKSKEVALGTPTKVSLAAARERAASARSLKNPIDERKRTNGVPTFGRNG